MAESCPRCGGDVMREARIATLGSTDIVEVCEDCNWEFNSKPFNSMGKVGNPY